MTPPVIGPERVECCPHCGAPDLFREEVDIGVGTMKGPASCENCGWAEPGIDADFDDDDDDWMLDPDMEDQ